MKINSDDIAVKFAVVFLITQSITGNHSVPEQKVLSDVFIVLIFSVNPLNTISTYNA